MVDLHGFRRVLATFERYCLAGVGIAERAGEHHAIIRVVFERHVRHVALENVVAGIAAVMVDVAPRRAELVTGIPSFRRGILHRELIKQRLRQIAAISRANLGGVRLAGGCLCVRCAFGRRC